MEGSYSKVWAARCDPPLPECAVFLDDLMATIRREIAACAERAYPSLPVEDAATLLFFDKKQDLLAFAAEVRWSGCCRSCHSEGRGRSIRHRTSSPSAQAQARRSTRRCSESGSSRRR